MLQVFKNSERRKKAQIILEFTFAMVMVLIMLFGVMMIFRWVGYDYGWRRIDHDTKLTNAVREDFSGDCAVDIDDRLCSTWNVQEGPIEQIDPYFHKPEKIDATWGF